MSEILNKYIFKVDIPFKNNQLMCIMREIIEICAYNRYHSTIKVILNPKTLQYEITLYEVKDNE